MYAYSKAVVDISTAVFCHLDILQHYLFVKFVLHGKISHKLVLQAARQTLVERTHFFFLGNVQAVVRDSNVPLDESLEGKTKHLNKGNQTGARETTH